MTLLGAVEAGGTKFVCGVGEAGRSLETATIPTGDFAGTMAEVAGFFRSAVRHRGPISGIGVGSFGPLDLDATSPDYGLIATTPKPGWRGAGILGHLRRHVGGPAVIDTDVNAAALAEARLHGVDRLAYVTAGTGIGVGFVADGRTHRGFGHPEAGHVPTRRHSLDPLASGVCPFHGDCIGGVASGPAIAAAWGASLDLLPRDHPAWTVEAYYVGQLCAMLVMTHAPERIVLGGGVMRLSSLLPAIRTATIAALGGYCGPWDAEAAERRIVLPLCAEPSGLNGAYLLAGEAARGSRPGFMEAAA